MVEVGLQGLVTGEPRLREEDGVWIGESFI